MTDQPAGKTGANTATSNPWKDLSTRLAKNDDEAKQRSSLWKSSDPLPSIPPSLLHSGDIAAYIEATGMIHPFHAEDLKPASYAFRLMGACRDDKNNFFEIPGGEDFEVRANSITFVTLEPYIRLPDYIALRFNLKIRNVYRGLLLGTGPLIDPGFEGRLSIPLHNLTENTYRFRGGETMIWVEFTKLSPSERWTSEEEDRATKDQGLYVPFPTAKYGRVLADYLKEASPHPILSSIPGVFNEAREAAKKATDAAKWIQIGTLITIVAVLGIVFAAFSLTRGFVTDARNDLKAHAIANDSLRNELRRLQQKLDSLLRILPKPSSAPPKP